jgi:hypothetical protein
MAILARIPSHSSQVVLRWWSTASIRVETNRHFGKTIMSHSWSIVALATSSVAIATLIAREMNASNFANLPQSTNKKRQPANKPALPLRDYRFRWGKLEARAGIEPAHKGFADHEEAANNPSIFFDSVLLSFLAVRFWSALSFDQSVYGFGSPCPAGQLGSSKCRPQASTSEE